MHSLTSLSKPILLNHLVLITCFMLGGCSSSVSPNVSNEMENQAVVARGVQASNPTSGYAAQADGIEITHDDNASNQIIEPRVVGEAHALATDSKHYAASYGVDHTEAMRRMLIQHDNEEQAAALRAEFG